MVTPTRFELVLPPWKGDVLGLLTKEPCFGSGGRIRTNDLPGMNRPLYPSKLRRHIAFPTLVGKNRPATVKSLLIVADKFFFVNKNFLFSQLFEQRFCLIFSKRYLCRQFGVKVFVCLGKCLLLSCSLDSRLTAFLALFQVVLAYCAFFTDSRKLRWKRSSCRQ